MAKQSSGAQVNGLNESLNNIRVLIADDHPAIRRGIADAIVAEPDMEVAGEAKDGAEAIEQFRRLAPHIVLIDLQMPRVDGLEAIATIHAESPDAIIIVLTTYAGDARVMRALTMGATSYLLKSADLSDIIQAIRAAIGGKHVVDAGVARELAEHAGSENLTPRELSVLRLAATGQSNRSIAEALSISEDTVKSRMRNIMGKLGAGDRTHAVTIAMQRGFLEP
jgi:DNA-binding NarL/FixJ family response regulator